MRALRRMLTVTAVALVTGYVAVCVLLYAKQREVLFPAPASRTRARAPSVFVEVPQGTWFLWRDAGPGSKVVVHFHGNAEEVGQLSWLADAWAARGVSFAAVEYPGYAQAPGELGEVAMVNTAERALEHLVNQLGVSRDRLVLSAQSVGTGLAVTLAEKGWGTRMVLLTPYTSLPDVAARAFPWLPVRLLMKDRFDSASRAPGIKMPVLIIHGTSDEVIPFQLGKQLSTRFPNARFIELPGTHHNEVWNAEPTMREVQQFVTGG